MSRILIINDEEDRADGRTASIPADDLVTAVRELLARRPPAPALF